MPRRHDPDPMDADAALRLRKLREHLGWSQRDLAREFKVTSGAVAQWEGRERAVSGPALRLPRSIVRPRRGSPGALHARGARGAPSIERGPARGEREASLEPERSVSCDRERERNGSRLFDGPKHQVLTLP
jgi:DNA-binding XRE family transcriptional regulator